MAWSLRALFLEEFTNLNFELPASLRSMLKVRSIVQHMWVEKTEDLYWRRAFGFVFQDEINRPVASATPKRSSQKRAEPVVDLLTPEKAGKKSKISRASSAIPVPLVAREPVSPGLKHPRATKAQRFLEPPVPDVEQNLSDALLTGTVVPGGGSGEWLEDEADLEDLAEASVTKHRKVSHVRTVRAKVLDEAEKRIMRLKEYLGTKKLTYGRWQHLHRQSYGERKAWSCHVKGFKNFKAALRLGNMPQCEGCHYVMRKADITMESVIDFLDQVRPEPESKPAEEPKPQEGAEAAEGAEAGEGAAGQLAPVDPDAVMKSCLAHIRSHPGLEPLPGRILKYHCRVCVSKAQPHGKINVLGPRPTLNTVKRFIQEHVNSLTHMTGLESGFRAPSAADEAREAVDKMVEEPEQCSTASIPCPSYCVTNASSSGSLHLYKHEFAIWGSHSPLDAKASHVYWQKNGEWFCRSKGCKETFNPEHGLLCCSMCDRLGAPTAVQRLVVSFIRQYHAAHLLCKKLFGTPEETREFIDHICTTAFGQLNYRSWEKVLNWGLPELQNFVRLSFETYPEWLLTENMKSFLSSVVQPCLRISVCRIDDNLSRVSAQFVQALENRRLSDPLLNSCFDMFM